MAQSLIDILIRARNQASAPINQVNQSLGQLDSMAGIASKGLAGLAAAAAIGGLYELASALTEVARRGAVFEQLGSVLTDFAASVGSSADAMIAAAKKASAGTISEYELILNANRAIQFEVAKTPEQFAKLIELSTALGRAQGIADTQALEFLTTGLARESRLILDNLGLIIDLDKATSTYAATLGKSANQLTQAERKQALLNEAYKQGAVAIEANRGASDSAATNFERMDASIQNAKDNLGQLFAPAVAVIAQNIADAAEAAAQGIENVGAAMDANQTKSLEGLLGPMREGLSRLVADRQAALAGGDLEEAARLTAEIARQNNMLVEALSRVSAAERAAAATHAATGVEAAAAAAALGLEADAAYQAAQATGTARASLGPLNYEMAASVVETEALNSVLANTPSWMEATARAAYAAGASLVDVAGDVALLKSQLSDLESAAAGARSAVINQAAGVADIIGDSRAIQLANDQLGRLDFGVAALTQRLKDGSITQTEFDYELARMNDTFTDTFTNIREADAEAKRFASQGLSAARDAARDAEQAFEDLKGKVAGVLSGALDPGVGVDPNDFLPREDQVNEQARRLADVVVNGFDSPWATYLKEQFPDLIGEGFDGADIKENAARILRDFQDGLVPQLLDKDTAKERVRRMLIGEAKMEELAREIAGELSAEMGNVSIGDAEGLARRALGVDSGAGGLLAPPDAGEVANQYGGTGATAAAAFTAGVQGAIVDADLGTQVVTVLDEQLRAEANLERLTEGGRISGRAWGSGFLAVAEQSIPVKLVDILTQLITPGVENLLNQRATLQGAR